MWMMANKLKYTMMEKLCLVFSSGFIIFFSITQTIESAKQTEKYESNDAMVCMVLKKLNETFNKKPFSENKYKNFSKLHCFYSVLAEFLT